MKMTTQKITIHCLIRQVMKKQNFDNIPFTVICKMRLIFHMNMQPKCQRTTNFQLIQFNKIYLPVHVHTCSNRVISATKGTQCSEVFCSN